MSVQISAYISEETKQSMEEYSKNYGVKKGFLIESAINHYLEAIKEIPSEFIVSTKLVLNDEAFDDVIKSIESPDKPTDKLKELMSDY